MKKLLVLSLALGTCLLTACTNEVKSNEVTAIASSEITSSFSFKYETSLIRNDVREVEGNALILNNYNIILDWTKQDSGWGLVENTKPVTFVDSGSLVGVYVQDTNQLYKVDYTNGLEQWSNSGFKYTKDKDILYKVYSNGQTEIIAKNVDKVYNNQNLYSEYDFYVDLLYSVSDDKTSLYNINHEKVLDLKDYNISVDDITIIKGDITSGGSIIITDDNVFIKYHSYDEDEILRYKELERAIKELQQKAKIKDIQWGDGVTVLLENEELYHIEIIRYKED